MKYVIVKTTRLYLGGPGYAGPTCAKANVPPGKIYEDLSEAFLDSTKLTEYNPVGFHVRQYQEIEDAFEPAGSLMFDPYRVGPSAWQPGPSLTALSTLLLIAEGMYTFLNELVNTKQLDDAHLSFAQALCIQYEMAKLGWQDAIHQKRD